MPDQPVAPPTELPSQLTAAGRGGGRLGTVKRVLGGREVRWLFVAVAVGLGVWAVVGQWHDVRTSLAGLGPWVLIGATAAVVGALLASMMSWRALLAALGSPLPVRASARIFFVGQLGKYLPGSVWPVLAQMELATAHRVPRRRSGTASVLTMLVALLAGLLIALATLPFVSHVATGYRWAFLAVPVLVACLHPKVLNPLLTRLLRLVRRPPLEQPLTSAAVARALGWAVVSWALFGLHVWLLAVRLGAPEGRTLVLALGGFAFAWCVGFLVVLAPAGAGVRDVLVIAVLAGVLGTGGATAVALVSRVLMSVGDLVTAGVAAWSGRRGAAPAAPAPAE